MFKKIFAALLLAGLTGCRTPPPLPPVNLAESGWTLRQGEAVWRARRQAPELAGELLLATHPDGRILVQFTKTPFPFVVAQMTTNSWQIELPTENRRYAGRGRPPARLIWLQLPEALAGSALPSNWSWKKFESGWRLENSSNGESLAGYLTAP